MPESVVVGSGPISWMAPEGRQVLIPLSELIFSNGTVKIRQGSLYAPYQPNIKTWLDYLASNRFLKPDPTTVPPKPAMVIKAADTGPAGNNIQVVFSNIVTDPADPTNADKTTFDATITEMETYNGLSFDSTSPSFIKTVLGTGSDPRNKPGLVHIKDADTPSLPKAGIYRLTGGDTSTKSSASVPIPGDPAGGPPGNAFQAEAKKPGSEGNLTTVTISNIDASAKTFTLAVAWTQSIPGIHLAELPNKLDGGPPPTVTNEETRSGYEIKVSKPDGGNFAIPAPGPVGLTGGADAKPATPASGTVLAS